MEYLAVWWVVSGLLMYSKFLQIQAGLTYPAPKWKGFAFCMIFGGLALTMYCVSTFIEPEKS